MSTNQGTPNTREVSTHSYRFSFVHPHVCVQVNMRTLEYKRGWPGHDA